MHLSVTSWSPLGRTTTSSIYKFLVHATTVFLGLAAASCSIPPTAEDVQRWREQTIDSTSRFKGSSLKTEVQTVDALRDGRELEQARILALTIAKEFPQEAAVLYRAARAEMDAVLLLRVAQPNETEEKQEERAKNRDYAAASSLDYARRGAVIAPSDAAVQGQLSWSLGATTHLLPMLERGNRAHETLEAIEHTRSLDPEEPTALGTYVVLHTRLATLPWIAKSMASAPPDNLPDAIKVGRRLVARRASVEHRLMLARALIAQERNKEAAKLLGEALSDEETFPRDRVLRPQALALKKSLEYDD